MALLGFIFSVLTGFATVWAVRKIFKIFDNAAKARQLGCKPITTIPPPFWDPWHMTKIPVVLASLREGTLLSGWWLSQDAEADRIAGCEVQTYAATIAGDYEIYTKDARNIQAILATQFDDFGIYAYRAAMRALLGLGIFTVDAQPWAHARALLRPAFTRDQINDLDIEEKHCEAMIAAIRAASDAADGWTGAVDLEPIFFRQTIDRATDFLFGESVDSQTRAATGKHSSNLTSSVAENFASAFDFCTEYLIHRLTWGELYWVMNSSKFRKNVKDCHEMIDYYVQLGLSDSLQDKGKNRSKGKKKYIFLEELVKETRDPKELREQLISVLLAGRDTSAGTLCYLFKLLAIYPDVLQKLRAAILNDFGTYDSTDVSKISFTTLKSCMYLQYCLNEVLRIYPQVASNCRKALRDTTLPRGGGKDGESPVFVPAGTNIQYSVYILHRDKRVWGEDVEVFRPERWEGRKVAWEYLPFNGGPRICIGQQFALTSIGFATVRLLQKYDKLELVGPKPPMPMPLVVNLTSRPMGGVVVRMHEAPLE